MTVTLSETRPGAYYDSVVLMQLQRALASLPGVEDAGVVMATPANCELLDQSGMLPGDNRAGPDDLLIVVKAGDEGAARAALGQVDTLLARRRETSDQEFRPRSLESAARLLPEARWVLVSVPGRFAAAVAHEALALERNVFLYSDNVPLADEITLKRAALQKGLLVMGPDCGTAIVGGVGLGFANRVRSGPIGLVGASGTGLQAVTSRIDNLGSGISQAIGTGGRDLTADVGGVTALQALEWLKADPQTEVIVLLSKPPAAEVAVRLLAAAQTGAKPVVVHFLGYPPPGRRLGNVHFATSLGEAADLAVELLAGERSPALAESERRPGHTGYLRGLFSGGTLAYEALLGLQTMLWPIFSNAPLRPDQALSDPLHSQAHTVLDLGDDDFTIGRLHPMMDNDLRLRRLRQEAADPEVGLILLDVVLGEGAHPDPAAELAPAIAEALATAQRAGRALEVVALLVGSEADPQGAASQAERLASAGAHLFRETMAAVAYAGRRLARPAARGGRPVPSAALRPPVAAINVGLESFYDSIRGQGATAVHVEWKPPAGGNEKLIALLSRMKQRPA
jgi:FdrA protein